MTYIENNYLSVTVFESKTREYKPWAPSDQAEEETLLKKILAGYEHQVDS